MEYIIAQFGEQEVRGGLVKKRLGWLPKSLKLQELFVINYMSKIQYLHFDYISGIIIIKKDTFGAMFRVNSVGMDHRMDQGSAERTAIRKIKKSFQSYCPNKYKLFCLSWSGSFYPDWHGCSNMSTGTFIKTNIQKK